MGFHSDEPDKVVSVQDLSVKVEDAVVALVSKAVEEQRVQV